MTDDPAIPAATLVLARECPEGPPELLMVERAEGMSFAAGALVFPGGRIDEADRRMGNALGINDDGARVAAVRETLEETAVPVGIDPVPSPPLALELQRALAAGGDFEQLLAAAGLRLAVGGLVPLARWVPKFHSKRRFDTLFLVAGAPEGEWHPHVIEGECTGAFWITARDALARDRSGEARLIFPTRRNLERLARHSTLDAIVEDARAYPIEPITPWVEEAGGERFITIAEDIGYPITRERLDGLWRG